MASGDVELRDGVLITGAVAKLLFGDVVPGDEALGDEAPALIPPCNLACDESTGNLPSSGRCLRDNATKDNVGPEGDSPSDEGEASVEEASFGEAFGNELLRAEKFGREALSGKASV